MKKKLLILLSICILLITSCGSVKHIFHNEYDKIYATELIVTQAQLDSVCNADTLSNNFRDWYTGAFVDYETNKAMEKRFYIRESITKRVIYILAPYDEERFKLTIRTEVKEEIEN